jgi:hypothetical protein
MQEDHDDGLAPLLGAAGGLVAKQVGQAEPAHCQSAHAKKVAARDTVRRASIASQNG